MGINSNVRKFMAHHDTTTTNHSSNSKKKKRQQKKAAATYQPHFSGQLLWNAIIPTRDIIDPAVVVHQPGQVEFINCGSDGQVVLAFDAGEEHTSWYLTLMEHDISRRQDNDSTTGSTGSTRY